MFDFVKIDMKAVDAKNTKFEVYPEFLSRRSKDLMIKGRDFYAVWDEERELWCKDEYLIQDVVDREIKKKVEEAKQLYPYARIVGKYLSNFSSNKWSEWQKYVKSLPDNYHSLDSIVTFANSNPKKTDYISKSLPYDMTDKPCPSYDELMNVLYSPEERKKLEWAIGAIISGDSKHIQKFLVLYGPPKSGKSTFLKIIQKMFEGYYSTFEAKSLGSVNNPFALEAFRDNPLLVIQHDGDLSKIEDNTKLNQIISHEDIMVNEKYKATYATCFNSFLILGTNKPVKITDAKSGIIRRLIDVEPTGNTVSYDKYRTLMKQIEFELGAIASHCLKLYLDMGENYYDTYKPLKMMGATNVVYNFLSDNYLEYKKRESIPLSEIWQEYKLYCDDGNHYKMSKMSFKEELKSYFKDFKDHTKNLSNVYYGLKTEKFIESDVDDNVDYSAYKIQFNKRASDFDEWAKDMKLPAQYANEDGFPETKWDEVTTTLEDIDSHELHYIRMPKDHIVIDFDLKDENGNKSFEKNLLAASEWPPTYAELSRSGAGIHLHYIYNGDVKKLERIYDNNPEIEIKVFTGKSALRRKLTKCNDVPIATISSGLPLKEGVKNVLDQQNVKDEKHLRNLILKNLKKEIHPGTKPSVDFIFKILEDAYKSGLHYDVSDMKDDIMAFANNSSHHSDECVRMVCKMKFMSDEPHEGIEDREAPIIFFDVEVFPNLFIVCWKFAGKDAAVVKMINPTANDVAQLTRYRMIGFNNRRYDNHIIYAAMMGYSNYGLYQLSQKLIVKEKGDTSTGFFAEAYGLSYTDVYDFSNTKQSLKKWEIQLGIHHLENSYPWDEDLDKSHWEEVADYCANDVIATEAVFEHLHEDWTARKILAIISGLTVNDTTNSHTTRIIVGTDPNPQSSFVYTDLSKEFPGYEFNNNGIPIEKYNPGTKIVTGKSLYLGEDPGEGGYVYSEPGIYLDVALLDIASMHPNSARNLNIFGKYQPRFNALIDARLSIKHKLFDKALQFLSFLNPKAADKLKLYLSDSGDSKALAYALKIPINSVYGLTSAKFQNKLKDPRNIDNIVAKRGALFMINLKHEVQKLGYTVAHIKTDSIKIPNADDKIISFVTEYGKKYGYTFEHEATYRKMCLVNEAVYIAQYDDGHWDATGAEFQVPYVFKKLFSGEPLEFKDYCQTFNVKEGELYLDFGTEEKENMVFIGKVGSFFPAKNGGKLYRVKDGKKYAAAGSKGFLWLPAESKNDYDEIDYSYFEKLAEEAKAHIDEFGGYDFFMNSRTFKDLLKEFPPVGVDEEVPFDEDKPFMNKPQ